MGLFLMGQGGLLLPLFLLLSFICCQCQASEYFVSLTGDDSNPGTIDKPWKHVQKAVDTVKPGDRVTIREGKYSEEVSISDLHGDQDHKYIFRAYPGEIVVFDGTMLLTGSWKKYKDNIYVTTLEQDIWQLFVDGEMLAGPMLFGTTSLSLTTNAGVFLRLTRHMMPALLQV